MALDHLGVIAARIRSSMLRAKQGANDDGFVGLKPLDEVLSLSLGPFHSLILCVGRVSQEHQTLRATFNCTPRSGNAFGKAVGPRPGL